MPWYCKRKQSCPGVSLEGGSHNLGFGEHCLNFRTPEIQLLSQASSLVDEKTRKLSPVDREMGLTWGFSTCAFPAVPCWDLGGGGAYCWQRLALTLHCRVVGWLSPPLLLIASLGARSPVASAEVQGVNWEQQSAKFI